MNQPEFRLDPDEREIWRGEPVMAPVRTPMGWLFTLMGLSAFPAIGMLLLMVLTMKNPMPSVFLTTGIIGSVILFEGLICLSSPWLLKFSLRDLSYRITDKRVLILKKNKNEGCRLIAGIPFPEINSLKFKAGKSGHGYVNLQYNEKSNLILDLFRLEPTALYNVENPEYVMQLIQSRRDAQ